MTRAIGVYPRQDRFLYSFNEDYRVRMGREPLDQWFVAGMRAVMAGRSW